jgi:hypothetical protein
MGEAYCGLSDNIDAIYWNPAGLNNVRTPQISAMHSIWFENIFFDYFSMTYPTTIGVLGFSANYLGMDDIDKYDNTGTASGDSYSPYDLLFYASYASVIRDHFVGFNFKVINSAIDGESATAFGVDVGYMKKFIEDRLSLGLAVQNIGTEMKFKDEGDPLPLNIKLGLSVKELLKGLVLASDVNFPIDNKPSGHLGAEYGFLVNDLGFFLRSGYKTTTIKDLDSESGISAGGGVKYKGISVDYAWVPYGNLGNTNRFAVAYEFPLSNKKYDAAIKKVKEKKAAREKKKKIIYDINNSEKEKNVLLKRVSEEDVMMLKRKYFYEGHSLFKAKKYKNAIKAFEKVLDIDPHHGESLKYIERAEIEVKKNRRKNYKRR